MGFRPKALQEYPYFARVPISSTRGPQGPLLLAVPSRFRAYNMVETVK